MHYQNDVKPALEVLQDGGLILYPTDTFWGIGCDATNAEAVKRIFDLTKRSNSDEVVVLVDSEVRLNSCVQEIPEIAYDLIELAEKPLTIIYSGGKNIAENLLSANGEICIRVTGEDFSRSLCQRFRRPVVFVPAAMSGKPSPQNFGDVEAGVLEKVDFIVKYRQEELSIPVAAGIIRLGVDGQVEVIRE